MERISTEKTRETIRQECLRALDSSNKSGTIAVGTGVGKTFIALTDASNKYSNRKILIVGPKLSIRKTWESEIEKWQFTNIDFDFSTYISLNKVDVNKYACVYFDECHNVTSTHLDFLKRYKGRIVGLTGSPPRYKRGEKYTIMNTYFPIVYEYLVNDAMNDGIVNKCVIKVHLLSLTSRKVVVKMKSKVFSTTEIKSYNYWTKMIDEASNLKQEKFYRLRRMLSMQTYNTKMMYAKHLAETIPEKCIFFTNRKDQASFICPNSYYTGNPDSDKNLEMFSKGEVSKLSAVLQLNEGINILDLKAGVIMHCYANPTKTIQRIGRLLRLNPDELSEVHILCYKDTVDEKWVQNALKEYKDQKVVYVNATKF